MQCYTEQPKVVLGNIVGHWKHYLRKKEHVNLHLHTPRMQDPCRRHCRYGVKHYNNQSINQSINQSTPMRVAGWIFNSWLANMIILQNNAKCTTCLEFLRITNLLRWLTFWVPKPVVYLNVSTRSICTQFYNKLCIIYNETSSTNKYSNNWVLSNLLIFFCM